MADVSCKCGWLLDIDGNCLNPECDEYIFAEGKYWCAGCGQHRVQNERDYCGLCKYCSVCGEWETHDASFHDEGDDVTSHRLLIYFYDGNTLINSLTQSHYIDVGDFGVFDIYQDSTVLQRPGRIFLGWAASDDGPALYNKDNPSTDVIVLNKNTIMKVYAAWEILDPYGVTYNANGGNEDSLPLDDWKTPDVPLILSSVIPTRDSTTDGLYTITCNVNGGDGSNKYLYADKIITYSFKNWNTKSDGTGNSYTSGSEYKVNADVTLYAQWDSHTSAQSKNLPTPTRTGYTFKGWSEDKNASSGVTGSYTPTGKVTLYAIWKVNSYEVTVNPDGGYRKDGVYGNITFSKDFGSEENITERIKPGYNLIGYEITNTESGSYTDIGGASLIFDDSTKTANFIQGSVAVTLTAQWELIPVIITKQPENRAIYVGDSTEFSVIADGYGQLSYKWQANFYGNNTWHDFRYANSFGIAVTSGWDTNTLKLSNFTDTTDGLDTKIRCIITSSNGESATTDAVTLTVSHPSTIYTKVSGVYKAGTPYVKVDGSYRKSIACYVKVKGVWKLSTRNT